MLADFNDYRKNTQISNFMEICGVEAELFHADGQTDMTLLIAFRSFAKVPNNRKDLVPNDYKLSILIHKAILFLAWTDP